MFHACIALWCIVLSYPGEIMSVHVPCGGWQKWREGVGPFTTTTGTSELSLEKVGCPGDRRPGESGPKPGVKDGGSLRSSTFSQKRSCSCLVGCLTSQQQASVSQGRICLDNFMCCHTEISISPSHSILTPGRPAPALTL